MKIKASTLDMTITPIIKSIFFRTCAMEKENHANFGHRVIFSKGGTIINQAKKKYQTVL